MATTTKETVAELQWLSDRLSTQVRTISLGVLAVAWALLQAPPKGLPISPRALIWIALVALLAMVADLLQYVVGYINTKQHHSHLLTGTTDDDYDASAGLYQLRTALFWGKQILACAAFVALVVELVPVLVGRA
jgi:hypothetical protein